MGEKLTPQAVDSTQSVDPSPAQLETLRHVADHIPTAAWLVVLFSSMERFTYFAFSGPLQNYIQNPLDDVSRPGALGLGQSKATALICFLNVLSYTTVIPAAIVADGYLGPFVTICIFSCFYLSGLLLLFLTSLPISLQHNAGIGGLIAAFILIGIGVGGIKSSVSPFLADQLKGTQTRIKCLPNGESVVIDREMTISKLYGIYYWGVNIGGLSGIASTELEKIHGFWAAFLLPLCSLAVSLVAFFMSRHRYVHHKPQAGILMHVIKILRLAIWPGKFSLSNATASHQQGQLGRTVDWDDGFVSEFRVTLLACRVWIIYPIVWLCFSQNQTNLVSQAAAMQTYGIPNDMMSNLNPISVLLVLPLMQKFIYPVLKRCKVDPRPTVRMTLGFICIAASMALAAGVQQIVYDSGPCYDSPRHCMIDGKLEDGPNHVSVALQVPIYVVGAVGETFFSIAGSEWAYNSAPAGMKSLLQAIYMLTLAVSSLLGVAISPIFKDPWMTIVFAVFAGVMFILSGVFAFCFWRVSSKPEER
ncbi:putative MFS peptide transporter [Penicillium brasilianum]|uniref:Putative MFS peptide transporter n=1 Tax=Penicillium brasilianum TaxID=104259 RepID=A0A1S9RI79_PENBI|nr:putative MFS peptide transporter [Penicillium brasilianum]